MRYAILLFLAACGPDTFTRADGGIPTSETGPDSPETDSSSNLDAGGSDARDDSPAVDARLDAIDAAPDAPCPTGTPACNDAVTAWCARMKACCAGQCASPWANAGGSQCAAQVNVATCANKMVCETACLSDLQSASCTDIKNSPAPAYVASSCWNLWQ